MSWPTFCASLRPTLSRGGKHATRSSGCRRRSSCQRRAASASSRLPLVEPDCVPAQGYRLELNLAPDAAAGPRFAHQACGAHSIAGAHCPNCDKPLLLLLSLDTTDPRLELADFGVATLPLLCCWTCSWNSAVVQYRVHRDRVELLRYPRGGVTKGFPYADYPIAFAGAAFDLVPAPSSASAAVESRAPVTQIGGFPQLLDGPGSLQPCHVCGRAMVFLASVGDTMPDGSSLTGNAWVQIVFLLCREDRVVAVTHEVD